MKITINGSEFKVPDDRKRITYGEVIDLVNKPRGASVTYDRGRDPESGIMVSGSSVSLKDGMVFNAMVTGDA